MPTTPRRHFDDDISRANAILEHVRTSDGLDQPLHDDLLRSAWMFAIGAMDAYFCDAYVSLLTRTIRGKNLQPSVNLPDFVKNTKVPVGSILGAAGARPNWRWRMAIRDLMEDYSVLSLGKVKTLFNPFLDDGEKLFNDVIGTWIVRPRATAHLFGISSEDFRRLSTQRKKEAKKEAVKAMQERFADLAQRRHDCIHNCDRPRVSLQRIRSPGTVQNVIRDVEFLVSNCDDHLDRAFPLFLDRIGCNPVTKNALRQ